MKKWLFIDLAIFVLVGILSLTFSPDVFSLIIVCVMLVVTGLAFVRGIWIVSNITDGFKSASNYIDRVNSVTTSDKWNTFKQADMIFNHKYLDQLWTEYRIKSDNDRSLELAPSDIENLINEDVLSLHCWKAVLLQIPGTLTALGLIGTFLGLILGISSVAFSSIDAAINSITMLLSGIETAFYTSIIGVILSIIFNISFKLSWNALLREMGIFMNEFHNHIIPAEEDLKLDFNHTSIEKILECLERIPKGSEFFGNPMNVNGTVSIVENESALMTEIWEGLKNDDFIFYLQPRCDINTKDIVGCEALMRWNHKRLGVISPTIFIPTLEKNGYIVKLDCQIWEKVFQTLNSWLNNELRPVPVSVNISKMDILVMDVVEFFRDLMKKYQIPPQYIQMEIAENAYVQCFEVARETEEKLRQEGFYVCINGSKGEFETLNLITKTSSDSLKIEYQVLSDKLEDDYEAVKEIIDLAKHSRVKLIASGIENSKQLTAIRKLGFNEAQGFLLYKPVSVVEFENLLYNTL